MNPAKNNARIRFSIFVFFVILVIFGFLIARNNIISPDFHLGFECYLENALKFTRNKTKDEKIEFVIARYNEDISWVRMLSGFKVVIYNKGLPLIHTEMMENIFQGNEEEKKRNQHLFRLYPLPNVGREGHTYLYHILSNYTSHYNSKCTIFLPASCVSTYFKRYRMQHVIRRALTTHRSVFFGYAHDPARLNRFQKSRYFSFLSNKDNQSINPEIALQPARYRPFGTWYSKVVGDHPNRIFCMGGIFAVSSDDILHHPPSYYENILHQVRHHSNPEAGHYLERAWCGIFSPHSPCSEYLLYRKPFFFPD